MQDRTGTPFVQAPEWQFSFNLSNDFYPTDGLVLTPFVEVIYVDEHFTDTELSPLSINDSYTTLNAQIKLADTGGSWELALVGTNLTDKTYIGFYNETGLTAGGGSGFAYPNIGSQLALKFRANY